MRFLVHLASLLLPLLAAASQAQAAALAVQVTDGAGKPLAGAVVSLEPVSTKLPVAPLAGIEIAQSQRQFRPAVTVGPVGTPVSFPNFDTVRHHVYSFSPAKTFELKLYAGVPHVPVLFDKAGIAVIGCNIHDKMVGWVVVVDTPHHTRSAADGHARLDGIAAGAYRLRVWHPALRDAVSGAALLPLNVGSADLEQEVRLNVMGTEP